MLKLMLEGVNDLLDEASEAKTMKARTTFIICAQAILEKCISSLGEDEPVEPLKEISPAFIPKRKIASIMEYEIRVDNHKLVEIVDKNGDPAPDDLLLEIDGKSTTYEEARGKSFTSGKLLG